MASHRSLAAAKQFGRFIQRITVSVVERNDRSLAVGQLEERGAK
jgi:hypothetical protein